MLCVNSLLLVEILNINFQNIFNYGSIPLCSKCMELVNIT